MDIGVVVFTSAARILTESGLQWKTRMEMDRCLVLLLRSQRIDVRAGMDLLTSWLVGFGSSIVACYMDGTYLGWMVRR